jgi:hypothetical protein
MPGTTYAWEIASASQFSSYLGNKNQQIGIIIYEWTKY